MAIKVVIFEDNDQLREMLFQMINISESLSCTGAYANAMDLEYKIRRSQPDIVLMDIDMPGINGVEAVKIIKEKYPQVKILMQTIFEDNDKVFDSICAGADGYLLKN
jgi:DNA-binding NarL/FixJ family response regulator